MGPSDYSFGDRLLHRLALGLPFVSEISFELDALLLNKEYDRLDEKHLFICGLARAGTTILMRTLYNTGQFRSLTYRDMPFVLMPGIWQKLSKYFHKYEEAKERAHSDGILVNFDSPEAFEEVFWRTYSGDEYIFDNCLRPHSVSKELINQFRLYIRRIVDNSNDPNQRRYLSKNNNNILRTSSIRKAFPNALIIIPFRDPFQQAISLLNQHKKFCDRHAIDKFAYDYMCWLGHHEFGATHRPFWFKKEADYSSADYAPDNINYWLNIWLSTYRYLFSSAPSDSIFICFEDFCEYPLKTLRYLLESADLWLNEERFINPFKPPITKGSEGVDENLKNQAQQVYQDLRLLASTRTNYAT